MVKSWMLMLQRACSGRKWNHPVQRSLAEWYEVPERAQSPQEGVFSQTRRPRGRTLGKNSFTVPSFHHKTIRR